jgi:hypothetical protein
MKSASIAEPPMSMPTSTAAEHGWSKFVKHLESKFPQDPNGRGRRDALLPAVRLTAWAGAADIERVTITRLMHDSESASRTFMGTLDSLARAVDWDVDTLRAFLREANRRHNDVQLIGNRKLKKKSSTTSKANKASKADKTK